MVDGKTLAATVFTRAANCKQLLATAANQHCKTQAAANTPAEANSSLHQPGISMPCSSA
jgi:hypothetical protein